MLAVLILSLTLAPAHWINQEKPTKSDSQTAKQKSSPSENPVPAIDSSKKNESPAKKDNEGRKNPTYWEKVISPDVLPNWILMAVGIVGALIAIFTLGLIYCQSQDTQRALHWAKKSAIAAKKSADAALQNAQAVTNAERAWIDGTFKKVKKTDVGWEDVVSFPHQLLIINRGRTPAYIVSLDLEYQAVRLELTTLPENLSGKSTQQVNMFLPPNRTPKRVTVFDMAREVSNADWLQILNGQKTGVFKAVIKYRDIISREDRETSFVYSYSTTSASFQRLNHLNVYK